MKSPIIKNETTAMRILFRTVNFIRNKSGDLIYPNGKRFVSSYRNDVRGNHYGLQEEVYTHVRIVVDVLTSSSVRKIDKKNNPLKRRINIVPQRNNRKS